MNATIRKKVQHFNIPWQAHELTFFCYRRLPLLSRDRTRRWIIESIKAARQNRGFAVLAFVIMPEHVHILVYPSDQTYDIAWFLKGIKQPVSRKAYASC
jgi:putative transposase